MPRDRDSRKLRYLRHQRIRKRLSGNPDGPRLCVFRSLRYIYAQLIDDTKGATITYASSLEMEIKSSAKGLSKIQVSELVGATIAERAKKLGSKRVVFDRGGYGYHGRVKALADSARKGGLVF